MHPSILSIDVEDWFHILDVASAPPLEAWNGLPSRVEGNFRRLLELLAGRSVKASCFFLGWVAERFPHLVKEAAAQGHEIASHGYAHRLVFSMTREEFTEDARRTRLLLEDLAGAAVAGYRSAGFSVTEDTAWFFDALLEAGYRYDSSVFPAPRGHGGMRNGCRRPYLIGPLAEFPITVADFLGRPMCFFGGGYLRLFPYSLIRRKAHEVLRENRPVVFYLHPREIDPDHPRLEMPPARRFKSYVNLATTERKLRSILAEFPLTTFAGYLAHHAGQLEESDAR
jgi:polysaccharide deacetylase family protein (PEP-CTERM system associated)